MARELVGTVHDRGVVAVGGRFELQTPDLAAVTRQQAQHQRTQPGRRQPRRHAEHEVAATAAGLAQEDVHAAEFRPRRWRWCAAACRGAAPPRRGRAASPPAGGRRRRPSARPPPGRRRPAAGSGRAGSLPRRRPPDRRPPKSRPAARSVPLLREGVGEVAAGRRRAPRRTPAQPAAAGAGRRHAHLDHASAGRVRPPAAPSPSGCRSRRRRPRGVHARAAALP